VKSQYLKFLVFLLKTRCLKLVSFQPSIAYKSVAAQCVYLFYKQAVGSNYIKFVSLNILHHLFK